MKKTYDRRLLKPLAALAALLTVCSVAPAQTKSAAHSDDEGAPRYEIGVFGGVQFWGVNNGGKFITNKMIAGGTDGVRFTYDFARHWGLEATWDIYSVNNLRLLTTQPYPVQTIAFGARNTQVQGGPVYYFQPRDSKFRIFLTVGPEYIAWWATKNAKGFAQSPGYAVYDAAYIGGKDNAGLFYGGGVKYNFTNHFGVRVDVRGIFTKNPDFNLPSYSTGPGATLIPTKQTLNGFQALLGMEYRFGAKPVAPPAPPPPPPPPPAPKDMSVSLTADQSDVCPGTPVKVTLTTNAGAGASYGWTVNGAAGSGDLSFNFDTTGKSAGTYTIAATVRNAGFNNGTGSTSVNIREYRQPSGSVTASPSRIQVGGTSALTSSFNGQCGGTVSPATYSASEGSISGDTYNSNGVAFDPNNAAEQSKSVTITATATDEKGGRGTSNTTVTVVKAANPQPNRLPDILFSNGSARVNNAGKRVLLEQLKTYLDRDPTGHVVFVGHFVDREPKPRGRGVNPLDEQRALNAAAIISAGQGICLGFAPSQILIGYTGTNQNGVDFNPFFDAGSKERSGSVIKESDPNAKYRRVEVYFVPTGAKNPSTATDLKDAASLGVAKLGCPK
jgi:outer membrane protein W